MTLAFSAVVTSKRRFYALPYFYLYFLSFIFFPVMIYHLHKISYLLHLRLYYKITSDQLPAGLISHLVRALHWYRRGHGFEPGSSLNFVRFYFLDCLSWVRNCDDLSFAWKCSMCNWYGVECYSRWTLDGNQEISSTCFWPRCYCEEEKEEMITLRITGLTRTWHSNYNELHKDGRWKEA